jgi:hypothetical protein
VFKNQVKKFLSLYFKFRIMETILISGAKKSDLAVLLDLAKRLGLSTKSLSRAEVEDWKLAQKIEEGMKTSSVSRSAIMKALGK